MDDPMVVNTMLFATSAVLGFGLAGILKKFNYPYLWYHPVNKTTNRNGGDLVAEVLKDHGVKHIFTLCGGHISPILVAAEKLGIKVIDTRHEVTAVFAADAVARMSGTVGVAAVTAGPGLTNTITAVKNAQMAESPILLLGGAAVTLLKGRGALQDIDQMALFRPLCKYSASAPTVREIIPILRKALYTAQSGTPGPVFVELPIDVLYPYPLVAKEMLSKSPLKSLRQKLTNWYMEHHLNNIFAGAFEERVTTPLKPNIHFVKMSTVSTCANLICESRRPLMIVGSQATLPPTPSAKVRAALERIGLPTYLGGMSRGMLGAESTFQMRHSRRDALKEADVIVLAGAVCDFRLDYGRSINKKAKIIAVNRDKIQLYKNSDMFWKPTVAAIGDVGTFLADLSGLLASHDCPAEWMQTLRGRDQEKEQINLQMSEDILENHLNPVKVLLQLEEKLPQNAILVADGGDFVGTAAYTLRPRAPLSWLDPGAFGTLGVGAGFAIGAKLCRPESQVWIVFGDGAFGYSLIEFDTMVRHKLPVVALIGNDAGWTQIAREQVPMFGSSVGCDLVYTNYHTAAEGLGASGILLQKGDDLSKAFDDAQKLMEEGKPVVVNALIGKSAFRQGSISV